MIESSTPIISIGIWNATENKMTSSRQGSDFYDASVKFFDLLDEALNESGIQIDAIDLIVSTLGPGSFTSLRTGLSISRGLSLAKKIPVFGLSCFDAMFLSLDPQLKAKHSKFRIVLDAMRKEHYALLVDSNGTMIEDPDMMHLDDLKQNDKCLNIGNLDHPDILKTSISLSCVAEYACHHPDKGMKTLSPYYLNEPQITCSKINS